MVVSYHRYSTSGFLEVIETSLNGVLTVSREDIYFTVQDGEDKQIYMATDLRHLSSIEVIAFICDVKDMMAYRTGKPGQVKFP